LPSLQEVVVGASLSMQSPVVVSQPNLAQVVLVGQWQVTTGSHEPSVQTVPDGQRGQHTASGGQSSSVFESS
jgi:hypothetical protein